MPVGILKHRRDLRAHREPFGGKRQSGQKIPKHEPPKGCEQRDTEPESLMRMMDGSKGNESISSLAIQI